jgi:hypothetical protein
MVTISTALRNFKEPTKEQLTQIFFSLPPDVTETKGDQEAEKMDINAVLSLGVHGVEDSYVSTTLSLREQDVQVHDDYRQENSI